MVTMHLCSCCNDGYLTCIIYIVVVMVMMCSCYCCNDSSGGDSCLLLLPLLLLHLLLNTRNIHNAFKFPGHFRWHDGWCCERFKHDEGVYRTYPSSKYQFSFYDTENVSSRESSSHHIFEYRIHGNLYLMKTFAKQMYLEISKPYGRMIIDLLPSVKVTKSPAFCGRLTHFALTSRTPPQRQLSCA